MDLPLHFWPWVVQGAAEIYNKTPRSSSPDPHTVEYGKPDRRLVPGDPVVYQTEKRQTYVGAYLGDRHSAARLVARCEPTDWNCVTVHVFNPKWTHAVPIVGFENALTWDALHHRPEVKIVEGEVPQARYDGSAKLSELMVPPGY